MVNAIWIHAASDVLADPTTFMQRLDASGVLEVTYLSNGWYGDADGPSYVGQISWQDSDGDIVAMIAAIKAHNSAVQVGFSAYSDDADPIDLTNVANIAIMKTSLTDGFAKGFDYYRDDIEYSDLGLIPSEIAWYQTMATHCHSLSKKASIYYGMHAFSGGPTADASVVASLTVDSAEFMYDPTDTYWREQFYNVVKNSVVPWMHQFRNHSDGAPLYLSDSIDWFTSKFSGGVPSNFKGVELWVYLSTIESEWTQFNAWCIAYPGQGVTPPPPPSGGTFGCTAFPVYDLVFAAGTSRMRGSLAAPATDGFASKTSAYLKAAAAVTVNAKCALFKVSDNTLVGVTDEVAVSLTTSYQKFDFPYSTPPAVTHAVQYYAIIWVHNTSGSIVNLGASQAYGLDTDYYSDSYTYGSFPDPVSLDNTAYGDDCIYTTYAPITPPTPPPVAASSVVSKQLISAAGTLAGVAIQVSPVNIDWDFIVPGTTKTAVVQIINRSGVQQVLHMTVAKWGSARAQPYLSVSWDRENIVLNPGASISATLTLTAAASTLGDTKFSFSISIVGAAV